ncbi:MAG TPA: ribosome recycling factor [Caldisericia bacterium]|nr:ribosome recycling factor [Caldisericia bacterium]HNY61533.1 ribosome recycling factor [Caldisericia bacterium]HOC79232.1 ribosome recycling factor [Caldisericia bacterium]HOG70533.1 ribosome recycling factor [Caldisericia bacterium]HPA65208.1 ribosome recycling factor [Caldisericia bacterium]
MDTKTLQDHMEKTIGSLQQNFVGLRAGRVTPAIVAKVMVNAYGSELPLPQAGNIGVPDGRTMIIEPWDKTLIKEIVTALQKANLGANPTSDGNLIRLPFPPLSQERRQELAKMVKKYGEDAKVAIRNIRRDAIEQVKKAEKSKEISEDERFKREEEIQKTTDKYSKKVDELVVQKEKEILES